MSIRKTVALLSLLAAGGALAQGDTLDMRGTADAVRAEQAGKPTRGMTQDRVRSVYGAPQTEDAAVGEPPISRWHYADFIVYFEYDRVIHAVSRR